MLALKNYSDVEYLINRKVLVIRRSLNVQIKKDDVSKKKKNIFQSRCHINNKVCL